MEKIDVVKQEALNAIKQCSTLEELNQIRVTYLGKKGPIQSLMSNLFTEINKEYLFDVRLVAAYSEAEISPMNG